VSFRLPCPTAGLRSAVVVATTLGCVCVPGSASAYFEGDEHLIDYTAYTLRQNEFRLGLQELEFGPAAWMTVGTDMLPYVAQLYLPAAVPNAHVKLSLETPHFAVAVRSAFYYAILSQSIGGADGASAFIVPVSVLGSVPLDDRWSLHGEASYVFLNAASDANVQSLEMQGTAVVSSVQLGAMVELRTTRWLALTLRGRWQPWVSPMQINATTRPDSQTTATVQGEVAPTRDAWMAIFSTEFSWKNFNMRLGAGYGFWFVPSLNLALAYEGVVGDADLAFRF
jgi:hypothetical protein